jgi:hypothetical protein
MTTLFWLPEGPRIRYERNYDADFSDFLIVDDLNPENEIKFWMTPMELMMFGFRCIWASIWP